MSIGESVPGPMRAIHAIGQTVAHHPLVSVIPPLSHHFGNCGLPPKVNLQPLVPIVTARTPCPSLPTGRNFVEAGKLRSVISVIGC